MNLGARTRALRTARQLSQETVAARLHVSRQAVAKWENGTSMPSTANLLALCALFDVPPEQLTAPAVLPRRRTILPYALFAAALLLLAAGNAEGPARRWATRAIGLGMAAFAAGLVAAAWKRR